MMITGQAHGPQKGTAACQLHMRMFRDGEDIHVEPWRAAAFPVLRDLIVDRSPFDRIVEAGGYITAPTGSAPDANLIPVAKETELGQDVASAMSAAGTYDEEDAAVLPAQAPTVRVVQPPAAEVEIGP